MKVSILIPEENPYTTRDPSIVDAAAAPVHRRGRARQELVIFLRSAKYPGALTRGLVTRNSNSTATRRVGPESVQDRQRIVGEAHPA